MVKVGPDDKPEWKPRYTMKQLLDPDFRLPTAASQDDDNFTEFMGLAENKHIGGLKFDEVG